LAATQRGAVLLSPCSWPVVTLSVTVPIAVIELSFDPLLRFGELSVRLETLALAAAILAGLLAAAAIARRTPARRDESSGDQPGSTLRLDDLLFIVLGVLPGAVLGGRAGHALVHLDYYAANPAALLDPAGGSLELGLAVVGGTLSGVAVARLLDGSIGSWLRVAAAPLLLVLSLGKLAMALGGRGQGVPTDLPWATAYLGAGPWASLAPTAASHPSQVYEAGIAAVVLVALAILFARGAFRARDARPFLVALLLWALGRVVVGETWRDPELLGPFGGGQLIALAIVLGTTLALAGLAIRSGRGATVPRVESPRVDPAGPAPL
jgi:prolipoprotein diacylglyceryltransferase